MLGDMGAHESCGDYRGRQFETDKREKCERKVEHAADSHEGKDIELSHRCRREGWMYWNGTKCDGKVR